MGRLRQVDISTLLRRRCEPIRTPRRTSLRLEALEDRSLLAPLTWSPGIDLPSPRANAAAVTSDGDILLIGGPTKDVLGITPAAEAWTLSGVPLDEPRDMGGAVAMADGRMLAFGGKKGTEPFDSAFLYDFNVEDNGQEAAQMNAQTAQHGFAADLQGRAYAFGGVDDSNAVLSLVERYDPTSDIWTGVAPLPAPRLATSAASDGAGHIFVFGGGASTSASSVSSTVYRYTVATNTWSTMAPLPVAVRGSVAVAAPNGKIYVLGGSSAAGPIANVQSYSYATDTWTIESDLPVPLTAAAATLDGNGHIVVIGGVTAGNITTADVWVSQDFDDPDTPPTITSVPPTSLFATDQFYYALTATGNPRPTYSVASGPAGLTVAATTGIVTWTPTVAQVGNQAVTIRATNFAGSIDQTFTITVTDPAPVISSVPPTIGRTSQAYSYTVQATGFPGPSYSLVTGPAGMTVHAALGVVAWTPAVDQAGSHDVTVQASNVNGVATQTFSITVADGTAPSVVPNLQLVSNDNSTATLAWDAATDNVGVVGYRVYRTSRCGWRGSRTCYPRLQDAIAGTSTTVTGLTSGSTYTLIVTAYDAAGNESAKTSRVTVTLTKPPSISYLYGTTNGAIAAAATHAVPTFYVYASGVPAPTVSLVSGPAGLTFDPLTKAVNWTPVDEQIGAHTATFRATNSVGSADITASFTVAANLPRIRSVFTYFGLVYSTPFAVEGDPFEVQLSDTFSGAPVAWSLVSGPVGMNVDAATGAVAWVPTTADALLGTGAATVRATNYAGSTDLTLTFPVYPMGTDKQPPTAVASGIVVSNIDLGNATVMWPPATDNVEVAGYHVTAYYVFRSRGTHTYYKRFDAVGQGTTLNMTGLTAYKNYTLYITAYDAAGNESPIGQRVTFTTGSNPDYPHLTYSFPEFRAIADQPLTIQLTDTNPLGGSTFTLVAGPDGMSVDPASGLVTWTPDYAAVGSASATFRATNAHGTRELAITFPVYFTGPVRGVGVTHASAATLTALVSWTPPADVSRVTGYRVLLSWSVGGRTRGSTSYVTGAGTSFVLPWLVGGPVLFRVTVSPLDAAGHVGASFPSTSFIAT